MNLISPGRLVKAAGDDQSVKKDFGKQTKELLLFLLVF